MATGYPTYGCKINMAKTVLNFDYPMVNGINFKKATEFIPWCGLLFNTKTLEVQVDFSKFAGTLYIEDFLTVDTSENQGQLLHRKMLRFIKAKCHPILIDSNINSPTIIRLNIYQNFMFSAIRFHSYIKSINKVTPLRKQNPQFLLNIILDIINYMNVVVKSCVTSPIGKKMGCVCELTEVEIKW